VATPSPRHPWPLSSRSLLLRQQTATNPKCVPCLGFFFVAKAAAFHQISLHRGILELFVICRSIRIISTGARLKVFVASSPPKPAPSITTLGFDCGMLTYQRRIWRLGGASPAARHVIENEDRIVAIDTLLGQHRDRGSAHQGFRLSGHRVGV
jgi:hypothetical protein